MNVMLIDDDKECLECLSKALQLNGFDVQTFISPQFAIHSYDPATVDVVITDYHLPDTTGIEILHALKLKNPAAPVIITSGDADNDIHTLALRAGAYAFLRKPINISSLISKMNALL